LLERIDKEVTLDKKAKTRAKKLSEANRTVSVWLRKPAE
jgi:hypothetical protein